MRPDNRAVDHHVFVITIGSQMPENLPDDTAFAPAAQTSVNIQRWSPFFGQGDKL
ncbi:hypothetical protein SXCC_00079 [Gluconacetobacter sp. SXCC-1]|nr:hypothetical protein SXCC_00079 [Gluconacetobacter sp. SXCC-1]